MSVQKWQPPVMQKTATEKPKASFNNTVAFCITVALAVLVMRTKPQKSETTEIPAETLDSIRALDVPIVENVVPETVEAEFSPPPVRRMTVPKTAITKLQKPKEKKVIKRTVEEFSAGKPNFSLLAKAARPAAFIKYALPFAKKIERDYGIPVSISLGQAILESGSGTNKLSKFHNYFAMKCFGRKCAKGHCIQHPDDERTDRFYRYRTAQAAFTAYAQLLSGNRYGSLKQYKDDYKRWAYGLKRRGYATARDYPQSLIATIERYNLDQY
jgi:flagellum-specific peptidoglycan hydrolase FlgJ